MYQINGVDLPLEPTTAKWVGRNVIDVAGSGHPIYPAVRQFEMRWNLLYPDTAQTLQNYFNTVSVTGTLVLTLPSYITGTFTYQTYSGCIMYEPVFDVFFNEHYTNCVVTFADIRT